MADRLMRAQVTIPLDSGIPEDASINTFYFDQDDNGLLPPPDTSYDAVVASLAQFYQAIDGVVFPTTIAPAASVRIYDMRDPEPRVVRRVDSIALTPNAGGPMVAEACICLSFSADLVSGVNPQRRRGRVFLGPVSNNASSTLNSQLRVDVAVRDAIAAAAHDLAVPNDVGGSSLSWAMYSRTTDLAGANIDDSFFDVQTGWIDDSFDTQRRRGPKPTTRTLWS